MGSIHIVTEMYTSELFRWFQTEYELVSSLPSSDFDLCIIDWLTLQHVATRLKEIKQKSNELYNPVLLISENGQVDMARENFGEIIDEIAFVPLNPYELRLRIQNLMRAREFSQKAEKAGERELQLKLQAQRLDNLSENVPGMIYQFAVKHDGTKFFEYISNGIRDIFEIEPREGLNDPMLIINPVHPEEIDKFMETLTYAIQNNEPFFWEGRYIIKGKTKWLRSASTPHETDYGLTWDGVLVDITALKEAEARIRDLAKFNEQIIESTHEGIVVCDTNLHITKWNRSMEEISGLAREQVIGRHPQDVFPFLVTEGMFLQFDQALEGKQVQTKDYWFVFADSGARGWAENTNVPLRDAKGEVIGVLCAVNEITERKNYEQELQKTVEALKKRNEELRMINAELDTAYDRLKNIDRAKTEFVTTASHEIRTPLASILGFVQTVLSPDIQMPDQKQKEYLKIVEAETMRLNQLVDTMLNISRLDAGKQQLQLSTFTLSDLVHTIKNTISIESKRAITINVTEKERGLVHADKQQISQVIRNILSNAIRYTRQGGTVEILIDRRPEEVLVAIKDQGPGIPPDKIEAVFEKFYRIKEDTTTAGRGSGLGLSIAREIIMAHNGKIWAESKVGEGSTFFFTLPSVIEMGG
ncbi:PAS domain S-box protein [Chitinispirillales bacterium ANBcel5]|uniref:PAS domain-containing sensor histidine kinase n=1 Tax=Cellulosispirillum alkaliphilum TaxID=3039283 RepID=UPI002A4EF23B|nr:PAS domain S-box protein [Chitinispirillales bacterium ANBcel5]